MPRRSKYNFEAMRASMIQLLVLVQLEVELRAMRGRPEAAKNIALQGPSKREGLLKYAAEIERAATTLEKIIRHIRYASHRNNVECPHCHAVLTPAEHIRVDSERVRCGTCGKDFIPATKDGPPIRTS